MEQRFQSPDDDKREWSRKRPDSKGADELNERHHLTIVSTPDASSLYLEYVTGLRLNDAITKISLSGVSGRVAVR